MKIVKILNNNTLIVDYSNKEFVVIGRGIGFSKKIGDNIDEKLIEKKYFSYEMPLEYYELINEIIKLCEKRLGFKFNGNIYSSLLDHIYSAIKRRLENIFIENYLLNEIKVMYKKEFSLSMDIVSIIYKNTNILLSESDAGFIAMHFIQASKNSYEIVIHINEIIEIINKKIKIDPFSNFEKYSDLINTIKRIIVDDMDDDISDIYDMISNKYTKLIDVIIDIDKYIYSSFSKELNKSQYVYLIIKLIEFTGGQNEKII